MTRSDDLHALPRDLPIPEDDGACDHLPGMPWPDVALPSTRGRSVSLAEVAADWLIVYFYPRTGLPDRDPPGGLAAWDSIPGARGCTPQACSYRDHHARLADLGARVFGVSTQDTAYQREAADRLHLPFELLSDEGLGLTRLLRLPTFTVAGHTVVKRLTLVGRGGRIETCFYPVFPPDADAGNVLRHVQEGGRKPRLDRSTPEAMDIRRATSTDGEVLLDLWFRSVRATHAFVSEEDARAMIPEVRSYLASGGSELWVLRGQGGAVMGFMGMSGSRMESLFLAPEFHRRGGGRRLVRHAQALRGELTVDVNEQNAAARAFYEACGFVVEGRSETDEQGRPYPLLHMRLASANPPERTDR